MDQTVFPSKTIFFFFFFFFFFFIMFHNGRFLLKCSAQTAPFDITTDASSLLAFRDHILTTSNVENILRNNWTSASNTTSSVAVCHWIGVTCSTRHAGVVALDLGNMRLSGTIPSHLGNLSFLVYLDISNNKFHGQLPEVMAGLHRLDFINVGFNSFSGNIPSWFGLLPQLKYISLQNNSFIGSIPPSLSNCSKLEALDTSYNQLSGMIPQEIGNLYNLKSFQIIGNQLSGEIPRSIFNISSLETLRLNANGISGSLPKDMCTSLSKLRLLSVSNNELEGPIPSSLQFCSRLEKLSLSYNKFHGPVPSVLGNLSMLTILALGGNNLDGGIPSELANLVNLKTLGLESAGLVGSIPPLLFQNITFLEFLALGDNSLSGSIPQQIGNCTSLNHIDIVYNHLTVTRATNRIENYFDVNTTIVNSFVRPVIYQSQFEGGQVPEPIGRLRKLEILSLGSNNLGGHFPASIFNITSLRLLSLALNNLTGKLPATIGFGLPNLGLLFLGDNQFSGTIPDSISNASRLTQLDLVGNNFTGSPPSTLGNLRVLNWLALGYNNLKVNGTTFITSLNSCTYLRRLYINFILVNGPLPSSFGNLTSSLQIFGARGCRITGKIPYAIGNMSNLQRLDVGSNQFVGSLPHALRGLQNLERLYAFDNNLSGSIPDDLCHLPRLGVLHLHINRFSGPLPACLGNVTALRVLRLDGNELSERIPASLWTLNDILELDLSSNSFIGYLPSQIGNLRAAIFIALSANQLSGSLPNAIVSLQTLQALYLAHNKFEGSLPESLSKLSSLEELDLSYNNLSGEIPKSLEALSHLKILNLSFNQLSGEIPSGGPFKNLTYLSFESNKALCGSSRFHVRQCESDGSSKHPTKRRKVLLFVYVLTGMILLTLVVLVILYVMLKCRISHRVPSVEDLPPAVTHEMISYQELLKATNSFDESNLLGKGSFGSVYKGVFANGRTWAVKVFHLKAERAIRSFDTECEMLRNVRHRNLTKVISSCSNLDFMALVLEYMPNGTLDKWLYSHNYLSDVKQRLDMMIDVASAVDYLHNGYSVPVVHCDLKPCNVLLDEDMVAHVSDFGISKFLKEESIVQTNTLGTIGYTAPEYGREGYVSTKSDVYSFGIMLMEVFTRRRPTEDMFDGDLDLKSWVKKSLPDRVMKVIDGNLVTGDENQVNAVLQCVSTVLELACKCSANSPNERMNIKDVLASLRKTKLQFIASVT